ncbi:MAG TPA: GAF domain-containing protein [Candidatus Methylomirabilis sp.]|nr:GAF domain-containing protein [Candidatus Methylomirabilis sp.]
MMDVTDPELPDDALREHQDWYRSLFDGVPVGIYRSTPSGEFLDVNDGLVQMLGYPNRKALLAINATELYVEREDRERWKSLLGRQGVVRDFEVPIRRSDGGIIWVRNTSRAVRNRTSQVLYYEGVMEDRTAQRRAEHARQARVRQQAGVAALGLRALEGGDLPPLMDEAVRLVARSLEVEYCKVLELLPQGDSLLLRAGVGWKEGSVGQATVGAGADSQAGYTLLAGKPVIVEDLRTETRFSGPPLLRDHGVISGLSVIINGGDRPFGVMGGHTAARRVFTEDDTHFLQAVANVLAGAIVRRRAEDGRAQLLQRLITAQEEERRRIARELHDEIGQLLTSLLLELQGLESLESLEQAKSRTARLRALVAKTLEELQRQVVALRPSILDDLGLIPALERCVEGYEATSGLRIDFVAQRLQGILLPPHLETTLYRIVQEALTNVIKHSRARAASVLLKHRGQAVIAVVEDEGVGFDAAAVQRARGAAKGLGLVSMKERAALVGGRLTIESEAGKGTTIVAEIPLQTPQGTP